MTNPVSLDAERWCGLDPRLLTLRRGECLALIALPGVIITIAIGVLIGPLWAVVALAATGGFTTLALWMVSRRFRTWGYLEREDDLLLRRGVLFRRTTVVPYGRMQYVDVTAGPLDRRFGLASVVLHTAALHTHAHVPGLATAEATRLRDRLARLGEARAAGV